MKKCRLHNVLLTGKMIAIQFLSEARKSGKPWLLYMAHNATHAPLQCLEEDFQKYNGQYTRPKTCAKLNKISSKV